MLANTLFAQEFNYFPIYKYIDKLSLTKKQRDKLADLRIEYEKKKIKFQSEIKIEYLDLEDLYEDVEKNLNKIEEKFNKIASLRVKTKMVRLKFQIERKKVLTKKQIEKLKELIGDREKIIRMRLGRGFGTTGLYFNNKINPEFNRLKEMLGQVQILNSRGKTYLKGLRESESKVRMELKKINIRAFPRFKVRIFEGELDS